MEFCGGGDLNKYHQTAAFDKQEFTRVCLELLGGVTYLHELNISHRDLKARALDLTMTIIPIPVRGSCLTHRPLSFSE